jgi:hypothetical protein
VRHAIRVVLEASGYLGDDPKTFCHKVLFCTFVTTAGVLDSAATPFLERFNPSSVPFEAAPFEAVPSEAAPCEAAPFDAVPYDTLPFALSILYSPVSDFGRIMDGVFDAPFPDAVS